MRTSLRVPLASIAAAAAMLVVAVEPASAHGGVVPQPLVQGVPSGVPGLQAEGLVAFSPRIRVTNDSAQELTVVDDSGRPWLRLSQDGVFADLTVRAWYESLDGSGRGQDPPADAPSGWTQVSVLPTWEWFDTDLLPRSEEQNHVWSIPVVVDGEFDEITGTLVESELEGRWVTDLLVPAEEVDDATSSEEEVATGARDVGPARLTAVSGSVPVFVVQRLDAEEVVVIGRMGEPLLRLTEAGFEVNLASPSWNDHARLDPQTELGTVVEDPDAEPVWEMKLPDAPTATWLDVRADTELVAPTRRSQTRLRAELPIVVDGERHDVVVQTAWVGDEVPLLSLRLSVPALIAASLGAGLLAAGGVRLWERRRKGREETDGTGDGDPGGDARGTAAADVAEDTGDGRHRE